jgi:hypothetical protein
MRETLLIENIDRVFCICRISKRTKYYFDVLEINFEE